MHPLQAGLKSTFIILLTALINGQLSSTEGRPTGFQAVYKVNNIVVSHDDFGPHKDYIVHEDYTVTVTRVDSQIVFKTVAESLPTNGSSFTTWHY